MMMIMIMMMIDCPTKGGNYRAVKQTCFPTARLHLNTVVLSNLIISIHTKTKQWVTCCIPPSALAFHDK